MTDEEGGGVERLTNLVGSFPWAQTMGKNLSAAQITIGLNGSAQKLLGAGSEHRPRTRARRRRSGAGTGRDEPRRLSIVQWRIRGRREGRHRLHEGSHEAGVLSVVKHFPGLGYATRNTDYGPANTLSWAKLQSTGLVPFRQAINSGAAAVMMSNARVPGLSSLPAGLSAVVVQALRTTLGFTGLIVTDSLSAGAISALHLAEPAASVMAIAAGDDLILYGSPASPSASLALAAKISTAIVNAVDAGMISRATLVSAAAQVLAARNQVACPSSITTTT
jgi:beta-N-acetylhexosaminidase